MFANVKKFINKISHWIANLNRATYFHKELTVHFTLLIFSGKELCFNFNWKHLKQCLRGSNAIVRTHG